VTDVARQRAARGTVGDLHTPTTGARTIMHTKLILSAGTLALGAAVLAFAAARPARTAPAPALGGETPFKEARIYWEYNSSADDLGVHVTLDAEDWKKLRIENPNELVLFEVRGGGPYKKLGMTELFFEGAEPALSEFPLEDLLALFPEGTYEFEGTTVDNSELESEAEFSHAIPDGPNVRADTGPGDFLEIGWDEVTSPPAGFPALPITIAGYQVIVESFQLTLPADARSVTVPPEFVAALEPGEHQFEVLAIEENGNQTLTEGSFVK
jgi:hypothetical protein